MTPLRRDIAGASVSDGVTRRSSRYSALGCRLARDRRPTCASNGTSANARTPALPEVNTLGALSAQLGHTLTGLPSAKYEPHAAARRMMPPSLAFVNKRKNIGKAVVIPMTARDGVARRKAHDRRSQARRGFCDRGGDDPRPRPPSRLRARRALGAAPRDAAAWQYGRTRVARPARRASGRIRRRAAVAEGRAPDGGRAGACGDQLSRGAHPFTPWADCAPTGVASGRVGVRPKPVCAHARG